jgi:uncharacterized protein DUF2513
MKRDMDLVRKILLALEAHASGAAPTPFTIVGYDQEMIGHHVYLMAQGDLVTAAEVTAFGESPIAIPGTITWKGHEFLDATRSETVWRQVRTVLKDKGLSLPFALVQELAIQIAKKLAGL